MMIEHANLIIIILHLQVIEELNEGFTISTQLETEEKKKYK